MWDATDLDGSPRILLGDSSLTVGMGAYEYESRFKLCGFTRTMSGEFQVTWPSQPGESFTIWSSQDLVSPAWSEEATIPSQGESSTWTDSHATSGRKFYTIEIGGNREGFLRCLRHLYQ